MVLKILPVTSSELEKIAEQYGTPFHLYDEAGIVKSAQEMYGAFDRLKGFQNFFAVKALPNPHILQILARYRMGADCSSVPEIHLAQMAGIEPRNLMFTSNNTSDQAFHEASFAGATINLDDITFIEALKRAAGDLPETLCFRYNPGAERAGVDSVIGQPVEAKYGLTRPQIFEALEKARSFGVKNFGLHTMVASNER
ncbi:MAG: diaminopimelate decarboxylase, partial [Candidatus Woesearchaeota archaeon]|nr:diaminopimelate decarboxylase [Candidatus Woesearchaeota archaeon]